MTRQMTCNPVEGLSVFIIKDGSCACSRRMHDKRENGRRKRREAQEERGSGEFEKRRKERQNWREGGIRKNIGNKVEEKETMTEGNWGKIEKIGGV